MVQYLLDHGADPNHNFWGGTDSALECAVASTTTTRPSLDIVRLLLEHGAVVHGRTMPLWRAARDGQPDIMTVLLDAGADPNPAPPSPEEYIDVSYMRQEDWGSALHGAAARGHAECVKLLLEKGAHKDVRNRQGLLPVEVAEKRGNTRCVEVLQ
jgi:ankyrin repeat protein